MKVDSGKIFAWSLPLILNSINMKRKLFLFGAASFLILLKESFLAHLSVMKVVLHGAMMIRQLSIMKKAQDLA